MALWLMGRPHTQTIESARVRARSHRNRSRDFSRGILAARSQRFVSASDDRPPSCDHRSVRRARSKSRIGDRPGDCGGASRCTGRAGSTRGGHQFRCGQHDPNAMGDPVAALRLLAPHIMQIPVKDAVASETPATMRAARTVVSQQENGSSHVRRDQRMGVCR